MTLLKGKMALDTGDNISVSPIAMTYPSSPFLLPNYVVTKLWGVWSGYRMTVDQPDVGEAMEKVIGST